jgi:hypothetical protein
MFWILFQLGALAGFSLLGIYAFKVSMHNAGVDAPHHLMFGITDERGRDGCTSRFVVTPCRKAIAEPVFHSHVSSNSMIPPCFAKILSVMIFRYPPCMIVQCFTHDINC